LTWKRNLVHASRLGSEIASEIEMASSNTSTTSNTDSMSETSGGGGTRALAGAEGAPDVGALLDATIERARASTLYGERLRGLRVRTPDELRSVPLTTRGDLERAGLNGTRAVPLDRVCHYGETSGTSGGVQNSTWLTAEDLRRNAAAIAARHGDVFAPGRILLNRFPFMAAPAHLIQLIAQQGGGIAIPAGNINWDVPFPKAFELAHRTGAQVLAGFPFEPIILGQIARARGLDPAKDTKLDTFFLGGSPLPPVLQKRIERIWGARVIELYGSTETMLLGTGCPARSLHLEPELVHCEVLALDSDEPAAVGEEGRLIVTTIGIEGSPLIRLETGDRVKLLSPCPCGDPRPRLIVLGRENDVVELAGRRLHPYEIIEAAAAAADALDSSVFFSVVMPDRLLVRIETGPGTGDPEAALREHLGDLPVEVECTAENAILDIEQLSRSPSVYKPILVSDWRRPGRHVLSVSDGMIEWPRPSLSEAWRWLVRAVRGGRRSRKLARELRVAERSGQ
jgi:phenylacetate-CoA ligase